MPMKITSSVELFWGHKACGKEGMLKFHSLFLHIEVCSHFLCPMRERHGNTFYFLLWPQIKLGEGMVHRRLSYFWGCFFFLHGLPSGPRCPLLVQEYVFQAVQREASSLRICLVSDRRYTGWLLSIITTYSPICIYHKKTDILTPCVSFLYLIFQLASNSGEKN